MEEKVLFEFPAIQTEDGCQYKMRRRDRVFVMSTPEAPPQPRRIPARRKTAPGTARASSVYRRRVRHALDTLENLYADLYPDQQASTEDSQTNLPEPGEDLP